MKVEIIWNKVEDMLPPIGKTVLTCYDDVVGIGTIKEYSDKLNLDRSKSHEIQHPVWTSNRSIFSPTHWAVIPVPVKHKSLS